MGSPAVPRCITSNEEGYGKRALRARFRAQRDALTAEERMRLSMLACTRLASTDVLQHAHCIALYRAFGSELDVWPLADALTMQGDGQKSDPCFVLPVTLTDQRLAFVPVGPEIFRAGHFSALPDFLRHPQRQLPEIPVGWDPVPAEAIDAVVVPGLAFDEHHMRLGYGGGYYDAFLSRARRARRAAGLSDPFAVGVCFDCQISAEPLPCASYDMPLDAVVSPARQY